jgi:predicted DNA-binding protein (UPF0251 family)
METNQKVIIRVRFGTTVDRLRFWNGPIGLSNKELEVLGAILDSKGEFLGTHNRRQAAAQLGVSKEVLNTYVQRLKTKKAVILKDGVYRLTNIFVNNPHVEVIMHGRSE